MHAPRPIRLSLIAATLAFAAAGTAHAPLATAAAPMVKTQAPGYHRMMLGDFEVTAISDGTVKLPMLDLLTNTTREQTAAALKAHFLDHPVEASVTAYLINTGSRLVLVDTGAAGLFGPTLGNVLANLQAAGYRPEQVDAVLITHMHPDHVGGLMAGGQRAFPNATVHIDAADPAYWLSEANLKAAPDSAKGFFQGAMASANPYVAAGRLKTFSGRTELVPGVTAMPSHGHTPGHTTYVVESQGKKLVLWGDLMHLAAVQFKNPDVTIQFDTDSAPAAAERRKAYADAAKEGYLVAATHLPFPGIGHLRPADDGVGYTFVPLNYSSLK